MANNNDPKGDTTSPRELNPAWLRGDLTIPLLYDRPPEGQWDDPAMPDRVIDQWNQERRAAARAQGLDDSAYVALFSYPEGVRPRRR